MSLLQEDDDDARRKNKPHAVCVPYPAQGHINPMFQLAKLLYHRGFHVTFVNTEFNHRRLLKSGGPQSLQRLPSFEFATIPDGLPPSDMDATQDIPALSDSVRKNCLSYFEGLLVGLNKRASSGEIPPVSCVVSDAVMSFTLDAAEVIGVKEVLLWTTSACGFLGYMHYRRLRELGYTPLQDASFLTNGYLDTPLDWFPGMKNIRLKDIPTFIRTTDPNDVMLNFFIDATDRAKRASAILINTFDALENNALNALKNMLPLIYTVGPFQFILKQIEDKKLQNFGASLWKEDVACLEWLDSKETNSVVLVNFGSITVMTAEQLVEFAWGLANSNQSFLWVIRSDLVSGESPAAVLPSGFLSATEGRRFLTDWCPQESVLNHPSVGGFLTHCGWNSTLESLTAGVPVICWPFFAEQQTNCRYCCTEWSVGMEIHSNVKRADVEVVVREVMEGEKGKEMKRKAMEWKKMAEEATTSSSGSSCNNLDAFINHILLPMK